MGDLDWNLLIDDLLRGSPADAGITHVKDKIIPIPIFS